MLILFLSKPKNKAFLMLLKRKLLRKIYMKNQKIHRQMKRNLLFLFLRKKKKIKAKSKMKVQMRVQARFCSQFQLRIKSKKLIIPFKRKLL